MRFKNSSGTTIELTTGVNTPVPMGSAVTAPQSSPAPICFDHAIVRAVDVNQAYDFAALTMGLKESGRIVAPDGIPVLGFFARTPCTIVTAWRARPTTACITFSLQ